MSSPLSRLGIRLSEKIEEAIFVFLERVQTVKFSFQFVGFRSVLLGLKEQVFDSLQILGLQSIVKAGRHWSKFRL